MDKHPAFIFRQHEPPNGGPPPDLALREFITPVELFFTRNHGPVPRLDPSGYRLKILGEVSQELDLSLEKLQRDFPKATVSATLQCAGNRRDDLIRVRPIPGEVPWSGEGISHAVWSGARLSDVLRAAGVNTNTSEGKETFVEFLGLDNTIKPDGTPYEFGGSIPLTKALAGETLLAYEMNGAPLPAMHGFPVRAVVPGYIGARSVKWLGTVRVRPDPSPNQYQAKAYRLFPSDERPETADPSHGVPLSELSINSFICTVERRADSATFLAGWAMAGGDRTVARVEVSADNGAHWTQARVQPRRHENGPRWSWCFWETQLADISESAEIVVRAWDSATNTQPESAASLWNFKGYMNNAWHRVRLPSASSG